MTHFPSTSKDLGLYCVIVNFDDKRIIPGIKEGNMQRGIDISKFHTDQNISSVCPKRIFLRVFTYLIYIYQNSFISHVEGSSDVSCC